MIEGVKRRTGGKQSADPVCKVDVGSVAVLCPSGTRRLDDGVDEAPPSECELQAQMTRRSSQLFSRLTGLDREGGYDRRREREGRTHERAGEVDADGPLVGDLDVVDPGRDGEDEELSGVVRASGERGGRHGFASIVSFGDQS